MSDTITIKDAAREAGVSVNSLRNKVWRRGIRPVVKVRGGDLYHREEIIPVARLPRGQEPQDTDPCARCGKSDSGNERRKWLCFDCWCHDYCKRRRNPLARIRVPDLGTIRDQLAGLLSPPGWQLEEPAERPAANPPAPRPVTRLYFIRHAACGHQRSLRLERELSRGELVSLAQGLCPGCQAGRDEEEAAARKAAEEALVDKAAAKSALAGENGLTRFNAIRRSNAIRCYEEAYDRLAAESPSGKVHINALAMEAGRSRVAVYDWFRKNQGTGDLRLHKGYIEREE